MSWWRGTRSWTEGGRSTISGRSDDGDVLSGWSELELVSLIFRLVP